MNQVKRFEDLLQFRVLSQKQESVVMTVDFRDDLTNVNSYLHGGVYFSLADAAAGRAAGADGHSYVTLNANMSYIHAVSDGSISAKATVVSRTRKTCIVHVDIFNCDHVLTNTGTYTMYRVR